MSASYRPMAPTRAVFADGPLWTPGRKAEVVAKILRGDLTSEAAMAEHGLSSEELQSWMRRFEAHGQRGLSTTRTQEFRA